MCHMVDIPARPNPVNTISPRDCTSKNCVRKLLHSQSIVLTNPLKGPELGMYMYHKNINVKNCNTYVSLKLMLYFKRYLLIIIPNNINNK